MLVSLFIALSFHHEIVELFGGDSCGIIVGIYCFRISFVGRKIVAFSHPCIVIKRIGSQNFLRNRHCVFEMCHLLMTVEHSREGTNIVGMIFQTVLVKMQGCNKIACIHEAKGNIIGYIFVRVFVGQSQIGHLHGFCFSSEHSQCGRTEDAKEGVVVLKNRIDFLQR